MRILFTKTDLDQQYVKNYFGPRVSCQFSDVIQIKTKPVQLFPLDSKALIFTSINGLQGFLQNGFEINERNKLFCVGKKSAKQLTELGFHVQKTEANAEKLAEKLIREYAEESYVHFCGNIALETISQKLNVHGIDYQKTVVYETEALNPEITEEFDAVAFFSPSGVRSFAHQNSLSGLQLFSIGKTTENEIKKLISGPVITSLQNTLEDLLKLMKASLQPDSMKFGN